MAEIDVESNLRVYDAPDVAAHYAGLDYLTPCERLLFQTYIPPGSAVLDLGVGGGRTTPLLASRASRYVGVDYAAAMIKACRAKFPDLEFLVANAADLSSFSAGSFHAVVFAFNGMDYVPVGARAKCFEEIRRVLKPGAVLIFSSHNPRAILVRPRWNRERMRTIAQRVAGDSGLFRSLVVFLLLSLRMAWANVQAVWATVVRLITRIPSRMFWNGEGGQTDPVHGGLLTRYAVPEKIVPELVGLQFRPARVLGDDYPRRSHLYATDWYYYVFSKPDDK